MKLGELIYRLQIMQRNLPLGDKAEVGIETWRHKLGLVNQDGPIGVFANDGWAIISLVRERGPANRRHYQAPEQELAP